MQSSLAGSNFVEYIGDHALSVDVSCLCIV